MQRDRGGGGRRGRGRHQAAPSPTARGGADRHRTPRRVAPRRVAGAPVPATPRPPAVGRLALQPPRDGQPRKLPRPKPVRAANDAQAQLPHVPVVKPAAAAAAQATNVHAGGEEAQHHRAEVLELAGDPVGDAWQLHHRARRPPPHQVASGRATQAAANVLAVFRSHIVVLGVPHSAPEPRYRPVERRVVVFITPVDVSTQPY